ncbi:MAG: DNA polymerase III subunit beta [Nitrospirae bacterium RBG_16_43_11]|nr:MAG: DNA polymerase III subunit beta [Nitrospirae bacterium RBG_16_43_11]
MKLQIEKGVLLLGLQRVQGIMDKRSTIPILSNILLEGRASTSDSKHSTLDIVATDLEIGMRGSYPAQIHGDGAIAVSGRKLYDIVRELPDGNIDISVEDGKLLEIRSGKSFFKIAGFNKEDFPSLPEVTEDQMLEIESRTFGDMIKKTMFAVADADARHVLNGALLEIESAEGQKAKIRMVATDGHRLALCERQLGTELNSVPANATAVPRSQTIIPKKTLYEMRRFLDVNEKIKIGIGEKQISLKGEDIFITSRLIDGIYPNYKQVIPKGGDQTIVINRLVFMNVIKRVSVMSREKVKALLIEFTTNNAMLKARDPEIGEAVEDVEIKYEGKGFTIGVNYQYILDALESMQDENVIIDTQTSLTPCIIKQETDPDHLCIVMPMRIQDIE